MIDDLIDYLIGWFSCDEAALSVFPFSLLASIGDGIDGAVGLAPINNEERL